MKRVYLDWGVISNLKRPEFAEVREFLLSLHESFITGNFGLYCNPSNCVHNPIVVVDDQNSFIFEIEVKGPRKLVLSENQMYPA